MLVPDFWSVWNVSLYQPFHDAWSAVAIGDAIAEPPMINDCRDQRRAMLPDHVG